MIKLRYRVTRERSLPNAGAPHYFSWCMASAAIGSCDRIRSRNSKGTRLGSRSRRFGVAPLGSVAEPTNADIHWRSCRQPVEGYRAFG